MVPGYAYGPAAFRRLALFPVAVASAAAASTLGPSGGLLPLPAASRTLGLNAPLWVLVSLTMAFALLWSSTLGQAAGVAGIPSTPDVVVATGDRLASAVVALQRVAAEAPAAPSLVLARLRLGQPWVVVEVDGKTVRAREPAQIEAALGAAGLRLEPGDRVVALPNTGRPLATQPPNALPDVPYVGTSGRLLVQRAVPFSVVDSGVASSHRVAADTVGQALAAIGINLDAADLVLPPHESPLLSGLRITVLRARPVTIAASEVRLEARSHAGSVGELLAESGVSLGPLDRVEPPLDAEVPAHGTVRVVRVREQEVRELRPLPFQTRVQYSGDVSPGSRQRVRVGAAGLLERVMHVVYEDENEARRVPLLDRVIRPAVDEIVALARPSIPALPLLPGLPSSAAAPAAPPAPLDAPVRQVVTMVATAYDPGPRSTGKSPGHPAYGITATGMRAALGVVAVDPNVIPFYTRLYVPGYGYAIAADTGGDIKGNRIDVFYPTYSEAIQWGRRTVPVYILE